MVFQDGHEHASALVLGNVRIVPLREDITNSRHIAAIGIMEVLPVGERGLSKAQVAYKAVPRLLCQVIGRARDDNDHPVSIVPRKGSNSSE